jgi:hypothetical protein
MGKNGAPGAIFYGHETERAKVSHSVYHGYAPEKA